jgi:hypothetical protein
MAWTVEYAADTATVVITGWDEIHDEDVRAQTAEAVYLLQQHHAHGVLADYSEAFSEASLPSLYRLPDYASELGVPWHTRTAVVLPRTRYRLDSYQFFELVCKNAGYNVRLFEAKEAAKAWLAGSSSPGEGQSSHSAAA